MILKFIVSQIVSIPTGYALYNLSQYWQIAVLAYATATIATLYGLKK